MQPQHRDRETRKDIASSETKESMPARQEVSPVWCLHCTRLGLQVPLAGCNVAGVYGEPEPDLEVSRQLFVGSMVLTAISAGEWIGGPTIGR